MNYSEALSFIHSRMKFGSRPGMERITALCDALGNPQDELKFVHVAGTNGKGSTCNMIAEILKSGGYKVGLFTSPFIIDFRERIRLNSEMIPEADFAEVCDRLEPIVSILDSEGIEPTEFELVTAAAFLYFKKKNCDIVVLEVGLGGLLDSTNIIKKSEVSVITSISMDHEQILGDTLIKIAEQKCGIFKAGGNVVGYPQPDSEIGSYIRKKAKELDCIYSDSVINSIEVLDENLDGTTLSYDGTRFILPLAGKHQVNNFATAIATVNVLRQSGWNVTSENMLDGIKNVRMPARVEIVSENPTVIIDGGHNPEGVDALCDTLRKYCCGKRIIAVLAMMADKDYKYCISRLVPLCTAVYATRANVPRSLKPDELAEAVRPYCADVKSFDSPKEAYEDAIKKADKNDIVLVCGSLYLASDIKNIQNQTD